MGGREKNRRERTHEKTLNRSLTLYALNSSFNEHKEWCRLAADYDRT